MSKVKFLKDNNVLFVTNGNTFIDSLVLKSYKLYEELLSTNNFMIVPTRTNILPTDEDIFSYNNTMFGDALFTSMISFAYHKNYDYIVYLDDDFFVIDPDNLFDLIKHIIENKIDIAYVLNHRYPEVDYSQDDDYCREYSKYVPNTFFHILNLKELSDYFHRDMIYYDEIPSQIFRDNYFLENYHPYYFNLIKNCKNPLLLKCGYLFEKNDNNFSGVAVYNQNNEIIGIHTYMSRVYDWCSMRPDYIDVNNIYGIKNYIDEVYNFVVKKYKDIDNIELEKIFNIYYFTDHIDKDIFMLYEVTDKYTDGVNQLKIQI